MPGRFIKKSMVGRDFFGSGDPISLHVFGKDLNGVSYSLVP